MIVKYAIIVATVNVLSAKATFIVVDVFNKMKIVKIEREYNVPAWN